MSDRLQQLWIACAAMVVLAAPAAGQGKGAGPAGENWAVYEHAAVAADHPAASQAGAEVLKRGGNAVDAAVAVSFALSVVRPDSCGIGGGGFMIIHLAHDPRYGTLSTAINYRETCPSAIGPDFYMRDENRDTDAPTRGGKAVAVPGTVAGLLYVLEKYGTLDRAAVLAPAIRLAREGYAADAHAVASVKSVRKWFEGANAQEKAARTARFGFTWERLCAAGELNVGDVIRLEEQARVLELIKDRGQGAFYFGQIAEAIVNAVHADGGVLSGADLAAYSVREMAPLEVQFRGRTISCMPPPSSGGIALAETFGILEKLSPGLDSSGPMAAGNMHVTVEAMKHAFADRARWLGDPEFVDVPTGRLISPAYLAERAGLIDPLHTIALDRYGTGPEDAREHPRDGGTSHFSVIDEHGNAVACTETVNLEFGSLLCVPEYGFPLNDQMDDFLTRTGEANAFGLTQSTRNLPAPGKRPLSSMSPTIAVDSASGNVELVVGASGGPRIISSTLQTALNALVYDMTAHEATAAPRFHTQWMPDTLWLEDALVSGGVSKELEKRGHTVKGKAPEAACQVILVKNGAIEAACDPRKGGAPGGY